MKFLIDGARSRLAFRIAQWPEGIAGQLLTPLTRYTRGHDVFGIDNGAFSNFNENNFISLLKREEYYKSDALFVACPDKVGSHKETLKLYERFSHLCDGWKTAFVAQDGYDGMPESADALFIGGTDNFKDSEDAIHAVECALKEGKHVHVGRVNGPTRFIKFHLAGAHTCDGSGVSKFDHHIIKIRDAIKFIENQRDLFDSLIV